MPDNFYMFFVAALIPMIIGAIYYHPKVFGTAWMNVNGFTDESLKEGNMAVILGVSYVLSLLLTMSITGATIHQSQVLSLFMPEVAESGSAAQQQFNDLMIQYGDRFRSFKHGALHGGIAGVFFVLPVLGINALFERRGWKYILVHLGYWIITLALMGGLLCQTLKYSLVS